MKGCVYFYVIGLDLSNFPGPYLEQITSGKWVDTQNWKHPNRDIKVSKSRDNR